MWRKNLSKLRDEVVEVEWYDICSAIREDVKEVDNFTPRELLKKCVSYGKLYEYDTLAIILQTEDCDDEMDYTAIPIGCIYNITKLERGGKNGE